VVRSELISLRRKWGLYKEPLIRAAIWQRSRRYWRVRRDLQLAQFGFARRGFTARRFAHEGARSASTGLSVLRVVAVPSITALLVVVTLGAAAHGLSSWTGAGSDILRYGGKGAGPAVGASLFATAAQIAGIFLGLYFTALSVLASTSYRDVPADLRRVVMEERAGTVYLKVVAFTGATSLYCLGAQSLGLEPGGLNGAFVALLSALSVLSFVVLGLRAFNFFDPSSVAGYLSARIMDAAQAATPTGYGWNRASFQAHQHDLAYEALDSLRSLVRVTAASPTFARGLSEVGRKTLGTLASYYHIKSEIPPLSYWFDRVARHESWLTASTSSFNIGLNTGTALAPKIEPDFLWIESNLIETFSELMQILLERRALREASTLIQSASSVLDRMSERFQFDLVLDCQRELQRLLALVEKESGVGASSPADAAVQKKREDLLKLSIIDGIASLPCAIIAAVGRGARAINPTTVQAIATRRIATSAGSPLHHTVPELVRKNLEFFGNALQFEKDVEGTRVSPQWFVAHNIARTYGLELQRTYDQLISLVESTYSKLSESKAIAHSAEAGVVCFQRGREACDKLRFHGALIMDAASTLESLRRPFGEQNWPTIDRKKADERISAVDRKLLLYLASLAPQLSTDSHTGELPDALGFASATLGNEAFNALLEGDESLFSTLFQPYLLVSLSAHDRALVDLAKYPVETQLITATDLLIDLADISGYAYLVSNSLGGSFWDATKDAWDATLAGSSSPERLLKFVLLADDYRTGQMMTMTSRDLLRTSWSQTFSRHMQEKGMMADRYASLSGGQLNVKAAPLDPLTHIFFRHNTMSENARDAFFVIYTSCRNDAKSLELPKGAKELAEGRERLLEWRKDAIRDGSGPLGERSRRFF
jgi:hypothetical protein